MIQYYNRVTKKIETEKVYGEEAVAWAYKHRVGFWLTKNMLSKAWVSHVIGAYEDSSFSRKKIKPFIERYDIPMQDFEDQNFKSFNEFFIRKFKTGKRVFNKNAKAFCAGAEARYLAFENLKLTQEFAVKGIKVSLVDLLQDETLAHEFEGGSFILARLCPVDYHRFHFPCDGEIISHWRVPGNLHSVNPVAIEVMPDIFMKNERQVAVFNTPQFGKVVSIEVGALAVGKIVQSGYSTQGPFPHKFVKGDEKGYFLFGGSAVIWLVKKGTFSLSSDLLQNSARGIETWIPLGDSLSD